MAEQAQEMVVDATPNKKAFMAKPSTHEERIKKDEGQIVFFAMSVPDYELMAYNTQELKRFITELQQVIVYYKEVTTVAD